jgi:hypothetical protein
MNKIVAIEVDPMEKWMNDPRITITVDSLSKYEDFLWEEKNSLYFARAEGGRCAHLYKKGDKQEQGFGGQHYHLNMVDGTQRVLKGPWSSNSTASNSMGFSLCEDVIIKDQSSKYSCGVAGSWGIPELREALKRFKSEWEIYGDGPDFIAKRIGEPPKRELNKKKYNSPDLDNDQNTIVGF